MYDLLGHRQRYQGYRAYVEAGIEDDIKDFYARDRTTAGIGNPDFLAGVRERQLQKVDDKVFVAQVLPNSLSKTRINQLVADYYKVEVTGLTTVVKGPKKGLLACKAFSHSLRIPSSSKILLFKIPKFEVKITRRPEDSGHGPEDRSGSKLKIISLNACPC